MRSKLLLFLFAAFLCFGFCTNASFATVPIPKGIGVCIHSGAAQDLDMVKAAGFTIARTDFKWGQVENVKGQYNWAAADQLVNDLTSRGIRPYFILDYNNPNYLAQSELVGICTPAQVQGFTNFAAAAAARYKGKGIIWEIWNEPNLDTFWNPSNSVDQYMTLLKSAVPAIKAADPNAIVIAPAVAFTANTFSFLDGCGKQGLYGLVDAISVHPYQNAAPDNGGLDYLYDTIRNQIKTYNPSNPNLPIIGGEFGFSTTWSNIQNETTEAQYLVRQLAYHDYKSIPVSMIYDFKNDGTDSTNAEHNFGLVKADNSLKLAYTAVQTFNQTLSGMTYSGRLSSAASDYIFEYTNTSGAKTTVAWTTGTAHAITVYGQSVNLTGTPIYVKNAPSTPPVVTIPASPSNILVTSVTKGATTGNYVVNLSWSDNSSNETSFEVQQSINSTTNFQTIATPAQNSTGAGINLGATPTQGAYYYQILAVNTAGKSQPSNVVNTNITTTPATTAPPSSLTAKIGIITSTSTYMAILNWRDSATNETGYDIYQSVTDTNNFKLVGSTATFAGTGSANNTYTIGANPPYGTYYYKVVAKFADGTTQSSNVASTTVKEYISPNPSKLKAVGLKDTNNKPAVILSWADNSINEQGFKIYFATSESGPFTNAGVTDKNTVMVIHPQTIAGSYYYKVTSFNSAGESTGSTIVPVIIN
ncbi:MAG: hypothetical protein WCG23_00480 [bacterium]